jgi:Arc/MetJ-type ribon-helix-helix transcriptional regulator
MDVSIPDSLTGFIAQRVRAGGYPNADAFVADLLQTEAGTLDAVAQGEPLAIDRHFDRRLEVLLDDAAGSGDYMEADTCEFDEMEREARSLIRREKTP